MIKKITFLVSVLLLHFCSTFAQSTPRVEPMFWWVGMKNPDLQLMVYAKDVAQTNLQFQYEGVELSKIEKAESPNYVFINLKIKPNTKPGKFKLDFLKDKKVVYSYSYELKKRENLRSAQTIVGSDVIYQLVPDRFANGDPKNDDVNGMLEKADRSHPYGRHGGDLKGMTDHLDYLKSLGMTAIWHTPLLENDMKKQSYHGYAITDFYKIDARFGTNEDYKNFVSACHSKGMKVVKDMVLNHCGLEYYWMKDLPFQNWVHQFKEFTRSNFRASTVVDIHASEADRAKMVTGWFDTSMPDLDQRNPFLAKFLIQNAIWWIEYVGLDAIRVDTQPYSYTEFVSDWAKSINEEYPNFFIVGESWMSKASFVSYFQKKAGHEAPYNSNFPSVFDFPLSFAIKAGLCEDGGWDGGITKVYETLADDYLYGDPDKLVTFLDNHDIQRFYTSVGAKLNRYKLAIALMSTTRGIPMFYTGTELLMTSIDSLGDGDKRKDFPGGWIGDKTNAFITEGRTAEQNEAWTYMQKLLNWRASKPSVCSGKLKQFVPENNIYVYFRYNENETVMVVINNDEKNSKKLDTQRFSEMTGKYTSAHEVISGQNISNIKTLDIPAKTALILELK